MEKKKDNKKSKVIDIKQQSSILIIIIACIIALLLLIYLGYNLVNKGTFGANTFEIVFNNGPPLNNNAKIVICTDTDGVIDCGEGRGASYYSPYSPSHSGYIFNGWGNSIGCVAGDIGSHALATATGAATYYPCWVNASTVTTYKITFYKNDGTNANGQVLCALIDGKAVCGNPPAVLRRNGYEFKGWGDSPSCTSGSLAAGQTITDTEARTYYGCWVEAEEVTPVDTYTLTFDVNGGSGSNIVITCNRNGDSITCDHSNDNKPYAPAAPTRNNYTFTIWGADANCVVGLRPGQELFSQTILTSMNAGDSGDTYHACWEANDSLGDNTVAMTFDMNGGNEANTVITCSKDTNGNVTGCIPSTACDTNTACRNIIAPNASRSLYDFLGWSTNASCSGLLTDVGSKIGVPDNDETFYACWQPKNIKATFYYERGNTQIIDEKNCTPSTGCENSASGYLTTPAAPIKDGYRFTGWAVASCTGNTRVNPNANISIPVSSVNYYGCWEQDSSSGSGSGSEDGDNQTINDYRCCYLNNRHFRCYVTTCTDTECNYTLANGEKGTVDRHNSELTTVANCMEEANYKGGYKEFNSSDNIRCYNGNKVTVVSCQDQTTNCDAGDVALCQIETASGANQTVFRCDLNTRCLNNGGSNNSGSGKNIDSGPQTGGAGVVIAFIIGFAAIIYVLWYFNQSKKVNK